MKRWITSALALMMTLAVFGCGGRSAPEEEEIAKNAPNYSDATGEFMTYAYSPPTDGTWWIDTDTKNDGVDYRTYENYVIYKESGLNTLLQQSARYDGEDFETSTLKRVMDDSFRAGITRTIVWDTRIWALSAKETSLIGADDGQFADHAALVTQIGTWMEAYKDHEAFYGVMLIDEPTWKQMPQVCEVYKAVKDAAAAGGYEVFVQENLLPYYGDKKDLVDPSTEGYADMTKADAYRAYLVNFVSNSDADRICMDSYPLLNPSADRYTVRNQHFINLQIMAEVAKEYNCKLTGVACSTGATDISGSTVLLKAPNRSEMYWQVNAYLGFGCDSLSYYTYWRKQQNSATYLHTDGTAFVSQDGTPTDLYYSMQKIHGEIQKFAPTFLNFKYQGANYYYKKPLSYGSAYVDNLVPDEFTVLQDVRVPVDNIAVVTELKDEAKNQYMYMVMNPQAPSNGFNGTVGLEAELDFGTEYSAVAVWFNGELTYRKLVDGKVTFKLGAGYAAFVMPY